jgi:hypothetical protein
MLSFQVLICRVMGLNIITNGSRLKRSKSDDTPMSLPTPEGSKP